MIAQTATRLKTAAKHARPPWLVSVTIEVTQGGVLSTSGSVKDLPWFDLGTAAWPAVAAEPQPYSRRPGLEDERWDATSASPDVTTAFQPEQEPAGDEVMARMESAAAAGDERAFLAAKDAIAWDARPPVDFLRAIQLALSAGAHMAARNLATQGATRYPENDNLQKYARVLAPPKVLCNDAPPQPGLRANRDWLVAHGNQYRGRWVALRQGQILGVSDSLAALKKLVGDTANVLMTKPF